MDLLFLLKKRNYFPNNLILATYKNLNNFDKKLNHFFICILPFWVSHIKFQKYGFIFVINVSKNPGVRFF